MAAMESEHPSQGTVNSHLSDSKGSDVSQSSLVKKLAATDKKTRDLGFRVLTQWLLVRKVISDKDLNKIWKGLFYCLWHADKASVQLELAESMASILHSLDKTMGHRFFSTFLTTIRREWAGIDRLRLDKYYVLIRCFFVAGIKNLCNKKWKKPLVEKFLSLLENHTLLASDSYAASGVNLHLADIYVDELSSVRDWSAPGSALLLNPFLNVVARSTVKILVSRVQERVFDKLLDATNNALPFNGNPPPGMLLGLCLEDIEIVRSKVQELASQSSITEQNRKALYALLEKLSSSLKSMKKKRAALAAKEGGDVAPKERAGKKQEIPIKVENEEENGRTASAVQEEVAVAGEKDEKVISVKKKKRDVTSEKELDTSVKEEAAVAGKKARRKKVEEGVEQPKGTVKLKNKKPAVEALDSAVVSSVDSDNSRGTTEEEEVAVEESVSEEAMATVEDKIEQLLSQKGKRTLTDAQSQFIASLSSVFEQIQSSPPVTRAKLKRSLAAQMANQLPLREPLEERLAESIRRGKMAVKAIGAVEEEKQRSKRVKFVLKKNLKFRKADPVPEKDLRTPPEATPKGSALKQGVGPGPIDIKKLEKSTAELAKLAIKPSYEQGRRPSVMMSRRRTGRIGRIPMNIIY